jgi:hypothetical protein
MQTKNVILVVVLLCVLVGAWVVVLKPPKKTEPRQPAQVAAPAPAPVATPQPAAPASAQNPVAAVVVPVKQEDVKVMFTELTGKEEPKEKAVMPVRDPMQRDAASVEKITFNINLKITGIVWDGEDPMAIVNGRVVKTGDVIQGATIVAVNPASVVARLGERDVTFYIDEGKVETNESVGNEPQSVTPQDEKETSHEVPVQR